MPRNTDENKNILEDKLKFIGLNLKRLPSFLKDFEPFNFKPTKSHDDINYKIYKYVNVLDVEILLTPLDRTADLEQRYKKAEPLCNYLDTSTKKNAEKFKTFMEMLDNLDLEEIEKYKTIYDIKIVRYYGKLHIIKFLKKNRFILLFLLLSMIIVFILSNMIFSVEVIHSNSKIIKLVTEELKDRGIKKYAFAKSYSEVEKIEKEILNNNKDNLEWLEIIRNGTKYTIRVEERIINKEIDNNKNYDIVSSKNAVIRVIEAESGEKVRDINTYVKKGETIISAYINTPSEEKILSTARGKVIGEVWYTIDINYPYYHHEVKYTGNKKKVLVFNFINKRISLFDFKKYKTFDKNIKSIFDNNVTPISLNYEYQYETEVIDDIYTKEEAKNKAVETAKEKLLLKYNNIKEVKEVTIVNEISDDEQLNLTLFVKAYEDITEYREVIINKEDTTS